MLNIRSKANFINLISMSNSHIDNIGEIKSFTKSLNRP